MISSPDGGAPRDPQEVEQIQKYINESKNYKTQKIRSSQHPSVSLRSSPYARLQTFQPIRDCANDNLHNKALGIVKRLARMTIQNLRPASKEVLKERINDWAFTALNLRHNGEEVLRYHKSWKGYDLRLWCTYAVFVLRGLVTPELLHLWDRVAMMVQMSERSRYSPQDLVEYQTILNQVHEQSIKYSPTFAQTLKLHLTVAHDVDDIIEKGPLKGLSGDRMESTNKGTRDQKYRTNHKMVSRDLARAEADRETILFLLSGATTNLLGMPLAIGPKLSRTTLQSDPLVNEFLFGERPRPYCGPRPIPEALIFCNFL